MPKLNQIVAVEKGVKNNALRDLTEVYRTMGKAPLLTGISRVYRPKDDEGEQLPAEHTKVQADVIDLLGQVSEIMTPLFNVTAQKDWTNCVAKADVVVDGKTVIKDAPVPYLLFLEKQLQDLHTTWKSIPTLEASEDWKRDEVQGCYVSEPSQTTRSKKVPKNHVRAEATKEHAAQVDVFTEDVIVGTWTTVKMSGAITVPHAAQLISRIEDLQKAVKFARETANSADVVAAPDTGKAIFDYLFG